MKKIALSVLALAALSTASLASQRGYDLTDTEYYNTSGVPAFVAATVSVDSAPLAVIGSDRKMTNFERLIQTSIENDQGSGH